MENQERMNIKIRLLELMSRVKENQLGEEHFTAVSCGFYDFEQRLGLERPDYNQLLGEMKQEGLIVIHENGDDLQRASIKATERGMEYLTENKN